eukprot:CAMPEP_0198365492 /NCGR_PEP_ID=MMETSP1450-20131203/154196_1 /TAXON_ID=753684 ORGANISM="Madagascaria erythrocladiodes, Strain CCMP3234" /NCGR_SAMPLE_ID=MMETSP1450 /ASSEMBLY_ACC=CAM_ASM_001115 /LENGTH=814 /DNA_ID=CAMNT_0044072943 /DNA_START=52 /DNA_END=2497 /DNA_ORIENTATION=+
MAGRPVVSVLSSESGEAVNTAPLPSVFRAPIRPDVVRSVHTAIAKNKRQPYAVARLAGMQTSAESWGTGRAVSRIPRVPGGGTHRSGQGAFGNMCRGGHMFAPNKVWRRWHRRMALNQRRHAVVSALAASAVPALVMARGHRIDDVAEVPCVVDDKVQELAKTRDAVAVLAKLGLKPEVEKVKDSRKIRSGKGKMRNRRHVKRRGPLLIYAEDKGIVKAFRNIPGVELCSVDRLNLLQLAPGGHLGRLCVWTESAVKRLDEIYSEGGAKRGYVLPRSVMTNSDLTRIINSDEIQSVVRDAVVPEAPVPRKRNALKNANAMFKLNPHSKIAKTTPQTKLDRQPPSQAILDAGAKFYQSMAQKKRDRTPKQNTIEKVQCQTGAKKEAHGLGLSVLSLSSLAWARLGLDLVLAGRASHGGGDIVQGGLCNGLKQNTIEKVQCPTGAKRKAHGLGLFVLCLSSLAWAGLGLDLVLAGRASHGGGDIVQGGLCNGLDGGLGEKRLVGRDDHVGVAAQQSQLVVEHNLARVVFKEANFRLILVDIDAQRPNLAGLEAVNDCLGLDQRTARCVDESGSRLHGGYGVLVDEVVGGREQRAVQRDNVGLAQNVVEVLNVAEAGLLDQRVVLVDIVAEQVCAKAAHNLGKASANLAGSNNGDRAAVDVKAHESLDGKVVVAGAVVGAVELAIQHEHECGGVLGDGVGRVGRDADNVEPEAGCGGHVDVVEAGAAQGDDFEPAGVEIGEGGGGEGVVDKDADDGEAVGKVGGLVVERVFEKAKLKAARVGLGRGGKRLGVVAFGGEDGNPDGLVRGRAIRRCHRS